MRRPALLLLPLLVLYLGVALVASPGAAPVNDEIDYVGLARNLTHGEYASSGDPAAATGPWARDPNLWFGPGLPATLAPLVALDVPLGAIRLTGPLFLFLAVLLFYRLLRLYAPAGRSLFGAALLGLYYPFLTLVGFVHSEPLAVLLTVGAMYFVVRSFREGRKRDLVLAAFALGYLAMTRVAFGWVLLALLGIAGVVALVRRRSLWARRTTAMAAIALVVCVPWLAYTYSLSGRPLYWGNSGGQSLYWMASPYPGEAGEWHSPRVAFEDSRFAAHRPFFGRIADLPSFERDRAFQREAIDLIRAHPEVYAKHVAMNVTRLFLGVPQSFEGISPRTLALYALPNLCLLLGVLGAVAARARRRLPGAPETTVLLLLAGLGLGVHALLAGYSRMLMPIVPILLWYAVTTAFALRRARVPAPAHPGAGLSMPAGG